MILYLLLLSCIVTAANSSSSSVEMDAASGEQRSLPRQQPRRIEATIINTAQAPINLYWAGTINSIEYPEDTLQIYYGPIAQNGGQFTVEGYENQVFIMTELGGYAQLGKFTLGSTLSADADVSREEYIITDETVRKHRSAFPPKALESEGRESLAKTCRSVSSSSSQFSFLKQCEQCASVLGCGFSLVRASRYGSSGDNCFVSHTLATVNDVNECKELDSFADDNNKQKKTIDDWVDGATSLLLQDDGDKPKLLRMAYKYLERAVEIAEKEALSAALAKSALSEVAAKLEAVFDDTDMMELLSSSRHPKLADIHPSMGIVPRRTLNEAMEYIHRAEPVVITNLFDSNDVQKKKNAVVHEWTLEYLRRKVFNDASGSGTVPKFNVAADDLTRCCRYFESQGKAKSAGYPYPFAPTTHLYRDTFDGFVNTVRDAEENRNATLHYLHEIVMNANGDATVAGGAAPTQLKRDLEAITTLLRPVASNQPFFGKFAFAKVWLGQRDIIMPLHYDGTDNLYVVVHGRKRAIIGNPGQLDSLYRYPNGHPLVGSSQVNLTEPDLNRHKHFAKSNLQEVVVGPGDVLYLPAWWWHQFEQPFEDTAALNLWASESKHAPQAILRDVRIREHHMYDSLEKAIVRKFGNGAGLILVSLANGRSPSTSISEVTLKEAKDVLISGAKTWQLSVARLPGSHPKAFLSPEALVQEFLDRTCRGLMDTSWFEWRPGVAWDLSHIARLPKMDHCTAAEEASPFMSLCD